MAQTLIYIDEDELDQKLLHSDIGIDSVNELSGELKKFYLKNTEPEDDSSDEFENWIDKESDITMKYLKLILKEVHDYLLNGGE